MLYFFFMVRFLKGSATQEIIFFVGLGRNRRREINGTVFKCTSSAQYNSYCKFYDPLCRAGFIWVPL